MNRRHFLTATSTIALSTLIQGCIPSTQKRLLLEGAPAGGDWIENALEARRIFEAVLHDQYPLDPNGLPFTVVPARQQFLAITREYGHLKHLTYTQAIDSATAYAQYLAAINEAVAPQKPNKELPQFTADKIVIPPSTRIAYNEQGYCMDPTLPAPGRGELLRLVRTDKLIPNELLAIYTAVLNRSTVTDDIGINIQRNMQEIVWIFRSAGSERGHASYISDNIKNLINQSYPNGATQLIRYHQNTLNIAQTSAQLTNALLGALKVNANFTASDFLNKNRDSRVIEQQLQKLINTPITGQAVPDSQYTLLAPGVAVKTLGVAPLAANVQIVNTSGKPFYFISTEWSAETQRQAQRIAFAGKRTDQKYAQTTTPDAATKKSIEKSVSDTFIADNAKFYAEKFLAWAPESPFIKQVMHAGMNPLTRNILNTLPIVGNGLSLYEAASGKNWLTQEPLGNIDRALALAGTIPGAAALTRLGTPAASKTLIALMNNRAVNWLPAASDKTGIARDLLSWANSDTTTAVIASASGDPLYQQTLATAREIFSS